MTIGVKVHIAFSLVILEGRGERKLDVSRKRAASRDISHG